MYHYNLRIDIFSNDMDLVSAIKSVPVCHNFNYDINSFSELKKDIIKNSDIIVFDLENFDINVIKDNGKGEVKVILCTNHTDINVNGVDEILIKPFDYDLVKFRFKNFLDKIKIQEENLNTNICLNTIIDTSPDMIWIKTLDGVHTKVNNKFCEIVGKSRDEVEGQDHFTIWNVSPDDPNSGADVCKKTEDEVISLKQTRKFQENIKINNNEPRQLDTYKTPLYDKNGICVGTVGFGHDVTDIHNLSAVNGVFFENMPYPALIRNNEELIVDVNHVFEEYFNVLKDSILNKSYDEWVDKTFHSEKTTNQSGFSERVTYPINGEEKIAEVRITDIPDMFNNKTGQICMFRDVTIERKLEEQNYTNSITDAMTGLYNRRYFTDFMENQTGLVSFLSIDLDHFKSVNDNYGHPMGDKAIILTAKILKDSFLADTVVRMGGDEFLIVKVGEVSIDELKRQAQKLLNNLQENFTKVEEFKLLSASMGIAQGIIEEIGVEKLMKFSDDALYRAKQIGRACYCVYGENWNG